MSSAKDVVQNVGQTLVGGPIAGVKDAFKRGKKAMTPQLPEITKPTVMPTIDDAAVQAAKRRSLLEQIGRRGRASTILTSQSDTLG